MDANQMLNLFNSQLEELGSENFIEINEADESIKLEVISSQFQGMRLSSRMDLVLEKIIDLSQNELSNYSIVINPLTKLEKEVGVSETSIVKNNDTNYSISASPSL